MTEPLYNLARVNPFDISERTKLKRANFRLQILSPYDIRKIKKLKPKHTVLMNIGVQSPENFPVLNYFLEQAARPKLIITAIRGDVFSSEDRLAGGLSEFLFEPYSSDDLLNADG